MSALQLDTVLANIAVEEAEARGEDLDAAALLDQLDRLARGVRMPPTCSVHEAVARLNLHLFDGEGFTGAIDDYGAPESSLLDQVLERRRGVPILLSGIYIEVARRCGVTIDGVGFPGHFLVSPRDGDPRFFLDPFHQGRVLDEDRLRDQLARLRRKRVRPEEMKAALRTCGLDHIQIRLDNNLKGARLRSDDIDGAIRATLRMLEVAPHLPGEQRELALMRVHQGRREEAIAGIAAYLEAYPTSPFANDLQNLQRELLTGAIPGTD